MPRIVAPEQAARFLALPQLKQAGTVLIYYGVGREMDTMPIFHALLAQGKRVAFPVCLPGRQMEGRLVTDPEQLVPGAHGIPAPDTGCPAAPKNEIDLVLAPCLMCDREGYRLGYGGGYYDRWLTDYQGFAVCICPAPRLVDRLPRDRFDRPVDLVLS